MRRDKGLGLRRAAAIAAALFSIAMAVAAPSAAQVPTLPPILSGGSPSPSPGPSGSPTSEPTQPPQPSPKPKPSPPPVAPGPAVSLGGPASEAIAAFLARDRSPARTTAHLLEVLGAMAQHALSPAEIARGFGRFPVAGYVWYQDDWGAPRYKPYFHLHEGTDLFAAEGTPVIAAADGRISLLANGSIGGNALWLAGDDGNTYYYGHLLSYVDGLRIGQRVRVGEILGAVGATGDAQGTYPHVHFEIMPGGGRPVNPKSTLDGWLTNAERAAENRLAQRVDAGLLDRMGAARWGSLADLLGQGSPFQPALWVSVLDPAGGTVGFADLALGVLAGRIDWQARMGPAPVSMAARGDLLEGIEDEARARAAGAPAASAPED